MAQASKRVRRDRRLRRQASIAMRLAEVALDQRDVARYVAGMLNQEIKRREEKEANKLEMKMLPEIEGEDLAVQRGADENNNDNG
jgi:hypothetical protein